MNTAFTTESALFGHVSPETARVVDDYPYGYRLRTQIRYWIETNAKHGDRFVSQTLNPKTARWNKPKQSTYSPVMAMFVDDEGHITHAGVSTWAEPEWVERFIAVVGDNLNPLQQRQLARVIGLNRAFANVTFSVRTTPATAEERAADAAAERHLARAVAVETGQAMTEIAGS